MRDPRRAARFYAEAFGCVVAFEDDHKVELQIPGRADVISLERSAEQVGAPGGISHFGFRLLRPDDIDAAVDAVTAAGGRLDRRGEFSPGFPYAFVRDLDGYEIEVWFE